MTEPALLGSWVRRFLLEHLVTERNLARNTQRSYRDTLRLLLPFVAEQARKPVDQLLVVDISAERVRGVLQELEETRGCGVATRNQRLAAIHALARFVGLHSPQHVHWCGQLRAIPSKPGSRTAVTYLEKPEMDALLSAPDLGTDQGRRDHIVLLFLYNTGARADEAAHVTVADLHLVLPPSRDHSLVEIRGKGNKLRRCPLWTQTVNELASVIAGRRPSEPVFLNRCGRPLTRFGIHTLVERYVNKVSGQFPSLASKQVSPHTIRHTTTTHLLRSGIDINTIRAWLGHVSINTTNIYAEVDLEMKAKALATCDVGETSPSKPWRDDAGLIQFLREL